MLRILSFCQVEMINSAHYTTSDRKGSGMTIQVEWHWNVKPGRLDDFIDGIRALETAARDDGLPESLRTAVWQAGLGGTTAGAAVHVVERESLSELADIEALPRPAVSAAYAELTGPEGPATLDGRSVWTWIGETGSADGEISWIPIGRPKPGKEALWIEALVHISELAMAAGATGVLRMRCDIGGPYTGLIGNPIFHEDLPGWATTVEHLRNQPEWKQLIADITGSDSPVQQPNNLWSPVFWRILH